MNNYQDLHDRYIRTNMEIEKMEKLLAGGINNIRLMGSGQEIKLPAAGEVGVVVTKMCETLLEKMKAKRHSPLEKMVNKA